MVGVGRFLKYTLLVDRLFRQICGLGVAVLAAATPAWGQAFNIDCAGNRGTPPGSSYGAGAGQPGFWNPTGLSSDLRDLNGNLTLVHLSGAGTAIHVIPGATGNDKNLMETTYDMAPSDIVVLAHLAAGRYDLYAYSWAQVVGPRTVGFSVFNGPDMFTGSVTYGAQWPGGQVEGVTFARIQVEVLQGRNSLSISIGSGHDYDVLAGIQLVPVPAPGAAVVLAGAGVLVIRRRRRD